VPAWDWGGYTHDTLAASKGWHLPSTPTQLVGHTSPSILRKDELGVTLRS